LQNSSTASRPTPAVPTPTGAGFTSALLDLIAYSDDFGSDKGNVDGDFTIEFDASNGIFTSTR